MNTARADLCSVISMKLIYCCCWVDAETPRIDTHIVSKHDCERTENQYKIEEQELHGKIIYNMKNKIRGGARRVCMCTVRGYTTRGRCHHDIRFIAASLTLPRRFTLR